MGWGSGGKVKGKRDVKTIKWGTLSRKSKVVGGYRCQREAASSSRNGGGKRKEVAIFP